MNTLMPTLHLLGILFDEAKKQPTSQLQATAVYTQINAYHTVSAHSFLRIVSNKISLQKISTELEFGVLLSIGVLGTEFGLQEK